MANKTFISQDRIVYSTERDLIEQDYEEKEWDKRFRETEIWLSLFTEIILSNDGREECTTYIVTSYKSTDHWNVIMYLLYHDFV